MGFPRARIARGCLVGALPLTPAGVVVIAAWRAFYPPPQTLDDLTLGGLCAVPFVFTLMGAIGGALGAAIAGIHALRWPEASGPRAIWYGAAGGATVIATPFLLMFCLTFPNGNASVHGPVWARFLVAAIVGALLGSVSGALGATYAQPRRRQ
jgi:hypothetical protein